MYSANGFAAIEGYTPQTATIYESLDLMAPCLIALSLAVLVTFLASLRQFGREVDERAELEYHEEMKSLQDK